MKEPENNHLRKKPTAAELIERLQDYSETKVINFEIVLADKRGYMIILKPYVEIL